jgi:signal transduction histidine kinase
LNEALPKLDYFESKIGINPVFMKEKYHKIVVVILCIASCFLFIIPSYSIDSVYTEKHILVLHSYHQGLEWTDNITEGIQSVLKSQKDINIVFDYLDFKRNYNKEHYNALLNLYQKKAKQIPYSAIIVSDNFAFDFMKEHSKEYYPGVPVFYCGVNNLEKGALKDYPNFYGIRESIDYEGTLNVILEIFPKRKNILVVCDNSLTGRAVQAELKTIVPEYKGKLNFQYIPDISLEELKNKVSKLQSDFAIYLLVFNRDKNGLYISYRNGLKHLKSVSKVPIFGSWDFYMNNGLFGGKITQGFDQGQYVGRLAKMYLNGDSFDTIPQIRSSINKYIFNYDELKKFGVNEDILPKGSRILNKPNEKEQLIKVFFITTTLLAVILLFLITRLQVKRKRAIHLEKIIQERTLELTNANSELKSVIEKKDKFFSILAHDLKNKIGGIFTFTKLLEKPSDDFSSDQLNKIYAKLSNSARTTYNLLEDLLFWGLRQFNKELFIEHKDFNVSDLLAEIIEDFVVNQNNVSIESDFESDLLVHSDYDISKFIFRNLVQNAVKFCRKGGLVKVITNKQQGKPKVQVIDNGIGMTGEVIKSIFDKKPILKKGTNGEIGTGLGLPTVIDFIELLGAKIKIESEEGKGSVFEIIFY